MARSILANSGLLRQMIWRRERVRLLVWIVALIVFNLMVVLAYTQLYQNDAERQAMAETMRNPAMISMLGPGYGLDNYTVGAMVGHQMLLFAALAVAIMNILLVSGHTRAEEESGRFELVRSLIVGRLSNLEAIFSVSVLTNTVLAVAMAFSLYACGVESVDLHGAFIYGFVLGVVGILFAGITALFAQLAETSRGTLGYSFATLGVFYIVRAVGDVANETLALLSPLGLILRSQAFVGNFWWPVFVIFGVALFAWFAACYLHIKRDLGAGLIPARPGRTNASILLQSPFGLSFKLQRTMIFSWLIGLFILGVSYGSVFGDLELFMANNEFLKELMPAALGFTIIEQFLAMLISVLAMMAAIPALLTVLKLRAEEKLGRLEGILARAISRPRILCSFLGLSAVIGALSIFLSSLGLWVAAQAVMDIPISFWVIVQGSAAQFPAILAMLAVAVLLIGWLPRYTSFLWLYLGYSFFTVYFGVLLKLPEWMGKLSPFGHGARMPVEPFEPVPVIVLLVISIMLVGAGIIGFRNRDIQN